MKGISALLASVLLIAFTVAIATLVMNFFSTTIRSSTDTITNKTATATECSAASISIDDVYITGTTARAIVKNSGLADNLVLQGAQLVNTSGVAFGASGLPLTGFNRGSIATLTFSNVNLTSCPGSFSKLYVTTNCGGVSDTFTGAPTCSS